jgi:CheY-like chemotaxis protein
MVVANRKVLVVEDDDSLRLALERLLNAAGFQVAAYASAEALLASAAAEDAVVRGQRPETACAVRPRLAGRLARAGRVAAGDPDHGT